jgi:arginase
VRDEDVVVFGFRDAAHAAANGGQPLAPTIRSMDLWSVRERGVESATREALPILSEMLGRPGLDSSRC